LLRRLHLPLPRKRNIIFAGIWLFRAENAVNPLRIPRSGLLQLPARIHDSVIQQQEPAPKNLENLSEQPEPSQISGGATW